MPDLPKPGIRETGELWASTGYIAIRLQDLEEVARVLKAKRETYENIPPRLDQLIDDLLVNLEETTRMADEARSSCAGLYPHITLYGHAGRMPEGDDNDGDNDTRSGDPAASG